MANGELVPLVVAFGVGCLSSFLLLRFNKSVVRPVPAAVNDSLSDEEDMDDAVDTR